ncbi:hypothetical protein V2J09_006963 [Rumex salicifolius]
MNLPVDSLENQEEVPNDHKDEAPVEENPSDSPPPPPPPRRREKDSRERRDDRDFDRPPNRRGGGGDYYDRNRSPLPPPPRDRERDYKRRMSPSPPPYRDRRPYSPSRRSPPFKRSRREDGGYGRGSPRGGYGNDRRFGYDHPGGYDRDMGGRPGYFEERPYGRFFGRSTGGYQGGPDWDSGRGGYGDMSNTGNNQRCNCHIMSRGFRTGEEVVKTMTTHLFHDREGLMSYKQFIQELEDDVLPSEAERRYQEYKTEYITTQKRTYFDAHKDEEWLRNKYHPTNLISVIERRNELARKVAKDFLVNLHNAELDLGPSAIPNKSEQTNDPKSDDEADGGSKRKRNGRTKEADLTAAPKAHPVSSEPRRIQVDIELALAIVKKLDSEKGITDNILARPDTDKVSRDKSYSGSMGPVVIVRGLSSVKGLEGVELLDTLVTYLWRVHGVDYYGMIEKTEPKGLRHLRAESKNSDGNNGGELEKKLDSYWQERLRSQDPLEAMTAKEKIDAAAVEGIDPYVRKIRDEKYGWKYGCGAKGCTKLFHAPEFVHKHIKLKHLDIVMELTTKVREDLYFQNYMNDPDAPGSKPVMQQSLQKDKLQRRRPLLENRLKDDRPNRRDREARGNGNERFDKSDNDDPEKDNSDEPMFEKFGGQGMSASPFAPDMPPSVLMPVPGAGPLGPFVPAPPEVAMQMMRDQGNPPPFEAGGRIGRPGMGAPPIILPPSFRQDPRRLRSYQDLDAPDDEVTVIDYRSL